MRLALLLALALSGLAHAANYSCSGSKGGVAKCAGSRFVCNDGSISGSKKDCSAELGSMAQPLFSAPAPEAAASDCSCRSGAMCTGPRGGRYCTDDAGRKSYERR